MKKRLLATLLIIALLFGSASQSAVSETVKEEIKTYYRLDTGVIFLWKSSSGTWQNGWRPGSTQSWTFTLNIGANLTNVKLYAFNANASKPGNGYFDFDNGDYLWNKNGLTNDRSDYLRNYNQYAAHPLNVSGADSYSPESGNVSIRYTASFSALGGTLFDVKDALSKGDKHKIFSLLGDPSPELTDAMNLLDSNAQSFNPAVEGYLVFIPVVIQYDAVIRTVVKSDNLSARLALPVSAVSGEDYTVSDDSLVGEDLFLSSARLEKHFGDGLWQLAANWPGKSGGQNSGGVLTESQNHAGTVTYRLSLTSMNGKTSADIKSISIKEAPKNANSAENETGGSEPEKVKEINLKAQLALPSVSYEGHPVIASDMSEYEVDGVKFSPARAYAEKIAAASFNFPAASNASAITLSSTEKEILFPKTGRFEVTLKINSAAASKSDSDAKYVEVLKTPAIAAAIGGAQKENRKQIISAKIAANPLYPLKTVWVEIKESRTGETIKLVKDGALSNSVNIKSRAMITDTSDKYFTCIEVPFLTKYSDEREFVYTVYAEDVRGQIASVTDEFSVAPDLPPVPDIMLETEFLRNAGSNTAEISASDRSKTDNDQLERVWYVSAAGIGASEGLFHKAESLDGYLDRSFGAGAEISFNKNGVGHVNVKLHLKDVWSEDTLPEYVSASDYLSAESAVYETTVQNIPPIVSLNPKQFKSAELLLMAASDAEYKNILERKNELSRSLIEGGIDARVKLIKLSPPPRKNYDVMQLIDARFPSGYNAAGKWLDDSFYSVDDTTLYTIHATWSAGDYSDYPRAPYFITARDAYTEELKWQYAIPESMFSSSELYDHGEGFAHDDDGKYLYFICGGKTLILDKESGALMTKLAFAVGAGNYLAGGFIYTVKSDGVYRIDISNGSNKLIFPASVSGSPRYVGGKARFFVQQGWEAFQCSFDPESESFSLTPLRLSAALGNECLGIDSKGRMIVSVSNGATVNAYDINGALLKSFTGWKVGASNTSLTFSTDEGGEATHIIVGRESRSPSMNTVSVFAYDLRSDTILTASSGSRSDFETDTGNLLLAVVIGNKLFVQTGMTTNGFRGGDSSDSYIITRARLYTFNLNNNTSSWSPSELFAFGEYAENSTRSNTLYAVAYSRNLDSLTADNDSHVKVLEFPQSENALMSRYLSAYKSNEHSDISAVVLFDNSGVFNHAQGNPAYADALGSSAFNIIAEKDADRIPAAIAAIASEPAAASYHVMSVKNTVGSESGGISKIFELEPARSYYYEYYAKSVRSGEQASAGQAGVSPASAGQAGVSPARAGQAGVSPAGAGDRAVAAHPENEAQAMAVNFLYDEISSAKHSPEKLYVTESHIENFSGAQRGSFFTYPADRVYGGVYNGADLSKFGIIADINDGLTDHSDITFYVPEGKRAVLSFDYYCAFQTYTVLNPRGAHFAIDGEVWSVAFDRSSGSGAYTHKSMLTPGTHTLSSVVYGQGKLPKSAWARLDNLRLDILDEKAPAAAQATVSSAEADDGWTKYSGSFQTPFPVSSYYSQPLDVYEGSANDIPFVTLDAGNRTHTLDIEIPQNKYALGSSVTPAPTLYDNVSATYTSGPYTMKYWYKYTGTNLALKPAGTLPIAQSGSMTLRGTTAASQVSPRFGRLNIYLTDTLNDAISQERYFFDKPNGRVYFANPSFNGAARISFSTSADEELRLRGFSVYYIENGRKVEIVDDAAGDPAQAASWTTDNAAVAIVAEHPSSDDKKEPGAPIYKKGELIGYNMNYSDYENDPSLKSFWRYTHTPFNDGDHPDAGIILDMRGNTVHISGKVLDESIERFYIDGKYLVEHWQRDNTDRNADGRGAYYEAFNKNSNTETLTFYIEGGGAAPWISGIETVPTAVTAGEKYRIKVQVDDTEKDTLTLVTEVFRDGKPVYSHYADNIQADGAGLYPAIMTSFAQEASPGEYSVVCTVSDASGAALSSYQFTVVSNGKIEGSVYHTDEWDENRQKYNLKFFNEEVSRRIPYPDYMNLSSPRTRGANVFWSGERFMLRALAEANPIKVSCHIKGYPSYTTDMTGGTARNAAGERIYEGSLWSSAMINKWGRKNPEELTFVFTAYYAAGVTKIYEETVIIDTFNDYWQLHRLF
ncbi:MAG: hypothetical protein LBL49_07385 [Clostridiales Family XIII bacterium]|nr:hypothetical protein [Clostridiales Family XIII bacterium]